MKSSAILIGNPLAGKASLRKLQYALSLIKAELPDAELIITEKQGDGERFSKEALKTPPDIIIAAGGDGTCNEVINAIAQTDVPMAVLPMGTTNVLAKELGIPMDLKKAVHKALTGNARRVSLGKISFNGKSRFFSLMAGIGYDAEVVYGLSKWPPEIKRLAGKAAYVLNGLKQLLSWSPDELTITLNSTPYKGFSMIVCNSSKYGGDFKIAPDADIKEPLLYVFIMHGQKRLDVLRYASGIIRGRHLGLKDIIYLPAKSINVTGSAHIQVDGDYIGKTPADIEVMPNALSLVV